MGGVKAMMMEAEERGWEAPETYVCERCIGDEYLKEVIRHNVHDTQCGYCKRRSRKPIAAPLESILEPIAGALFTRYAEPTEAGLPWDRGWVDGGRMTDTRDALEDIGVECEEPLFDDIVGAFMNDAWFPCARGYWLGEQPNRQMGYAWQAFVQQVKHQTRFFFGEVEAGRPEMDVPEEYSPATILQDIGRMVQSVQLLGTLDAGTNLYRARKSDELLTDMKDLGPPPEEIVGAGRMNPAGIAYFYLAASAETAVAETLRGDPRKYLVATFRTSAAFPILDLSALPPLPSIFDAGRQYEREALLFLRDFVRDISVPIARDGREHIDYVPSQIVSEYFAQVAVGPSGEKIRGLAWNSAVDGGKNVVLFPMQSHRFKWENMVELVDVQHVDPAK